MATNQIRVSYGLTVKKDDPQAVYLKKLAAFLTILSAIYTHINDIILQIWAISQLFNLSVCKNTLPLLTTTVRKWTAHGSVFLV